MQTQIGGGLEGVEGGPGSAEGVAVSTAGGGGGADRRGRSSDSDVGADGGKGGPEGGDNLGHSELGGPADGCGQ